MKYARFRLRENDVITFEEGKISEINKRRNEIILTEGEAIEVKIGLNDGEKIVSGDTIGIVEDKYNEIVVIVKDKKGIGIIEDMEYGGDDSLIDCLDGIGCELAKGGLSDITIWYRELQ
ncbi:MAG: hypothetical protein ACLTK7_08785 [Clostridium paraputrificum]|uniref:hypothetical protein n=1 Tax=Clostridium paraputrificum TaxID=29363 RepID=UPI000C080D3E|nr:hypothetical protein [Clostridium paraputrificum]